ncbi:MAG: phage head closure protein [Pseudodesulfovibrio sp.]|nr:phage head closure protein [Pseudodesulfovibrio sp.]
MGAAKYRHKIFFLKSTDTGDGMGGTGKATWVPHGNSVRAAIWPISGKEAVSNLRDEGTITHRIHVRYVAGVTSNMRIQFGDRQFEIKGPPIDFEERHRELQIMATEIEFKEVS